jgi:hypothetical protein
MTSEVWEDEGDHYCFQSARVESDEAWIFELSEARRAPASWAGTPHQDAFMPGVVAVTVVAHDPAVEKPPYVHFDAEQSIPLTVLRRFVSSVTALLDNHGVQP